VPRVQGGPTGTAQTTQGTNKRCGRGDRRKWRGHRIGAHPARTSLLCRIVGGSSAGDQFRHVVREVVGDPDVGAIRRDSERKLADGDGGDDGVSGRINLRHRATEGVGDPDVGAIKRHPRESCTSIDRLTSTTGQHRPRLHPLDRGTSTRVGTVHRLETTGGGNDGVISTRCPCIGGTTVTLLVRSGRTQLSVRARLFGGGRAPVTRAGSGRGLGAACSHSEIAVVRLRSDDLLG
jgi:hypothetical protein